MRKALVHFVFGMLAIVLSVDRSSAQAPSFLPGEAEAICSGIVNRVMTAIVDNATYSCGFSNPDGRWTPNRQYQMNKCVAAINLPRIQDYWAYLSVATGLSDQVDVCKLTHVNKNCVSCHSSQAPSALQPEPLRRRPLANAPVPPRLPQGNNTSGSNMSRQPKDSAPATSAMDRLGGGGITPVAPSGGGSSGVNLSRPGRAPSSGGSSGAAPVAAPSGGGSSGFNTSKPISPPSGGGSSGFNTSKP
jgi:hypothetical protein